MEGDHAVTAEIAALDAAQLHGILAATAMPFGSQFLIRMLATPDLHTLLSFRKVILEGQPNPEFYRPEPDEHESTFWLLGEYGISLGLFDGDSLVAYTSMGLANDASAFEKVCPCPVTAIKKYCEPSEAAYMAASMVLPEYRSRGISTALIELKCQLAEMLGRTHCFGVVHPTNAVPLHNQLKCRYHVADLLKLSDVNFGVLTRFLTCRPPSVVRFGGPVRWIDTANEEAQTELLSLGYKGVRCRARTNVLQVGYRRACVEPMTDMGGHERTICR